MNLDDSVPVSRAFLIRLLAAVLLLGSCGRSGSGGHTGAELPGPSSPGAAPGRQRSQDGLGLELPKPGGGTFFLDPNQGGNGASLRIAETFWGRLVEVHDVDASGAENLEPRFRDFVVNANVQSDGLSYTLVQGPITQKARLVIHAKKGSPEFDALLRAAVQGLPAIVPKHDDGSSSPPFSLVARNACLVLRFDDCLRDDAAAERDLLETVRIRTGYPPLVLFSARLRFDPNHGCLVGGEFHSTRVLVDLTVSELEAQELPFPLPVNAVGLPESAPASLLPNVSVRIPTREDFGSGQFVLLRNLAGVALDPAGNGPVDLGSPTVDVVRAMRSGNSSDPGNGFLLDLERPHVLGSFPVVVEQARFLDDGSLAVHLGLSSQCRLLPRAQDVLSIGGFVLEVLEVSPAPLGRVELRVRSATGVSDPSSLLGNGLLLAAYTPTRAPRLPVACWVSFLPRPPARPPVVSSTAHVQVRFTEPIDEEPLAARDSFLVVRGLADQSMSTAGPSTIVVGEVQASAGLDAFSFEPLLPLAHVQGTAEPYHVELLEVRDLAGNRLRHELPFVDFRLDPSEATHANGGIVLRFNAVDEVGPDGFPDLRGQFFYDLSRGALLPRPVAFTGFPADRTNPVPSIMISLPFGVQTPLVPLGSKLHSVWRYCDLGISVRDETKYNLDVVGLSWAPFGGTVISDFYDQFEIRLAHSRFLPDESIDGNLLPRWPASGLLGRPSAFTDNILLDPLSPQMVVHNRALGYAVRASDLFQSASGTVMLPYPLNRGGGPLTSYTWRDTAVLAEAGPANQGIPMDIEAGPPLFLEPAAGTLAPAGAVPSIGLPLLVEIRCFPSDVALGLNPLDVSLAINSSARPAFRAFSSGGFNTAGLPVIVNPDTELVPQGGFNPLSSPPGQRTLPADNLFYIGQMDVVPRVSRAHTIWLDTGVTSPAYLAPLLAPRAADLPAGTQVLLDYRGALGFSAATPFDATRLDAYGDVTAGTVSFLNGDATWKSDIGALDGARYLQVRLTFRNDLATRRSPETTALAIPFRSN